ncbi:MAG: hypothetical protein AAGE52_12740 [Myxococcota bacterium]
MVDGAIRRGCRRPTDWFLVIQTDEGRQIARTAEEIATALQPIETPAQALALLGALVPGLWTPMENRNSSRYRWTAVEPAPRVGMGCDAEGDAYVCRWAWLPYCGCYHPLVMRVFRVGRDGSVIEQRSERQLVARCGRGPCID